MPIGRTYLLEQLGLTGDEEPARLSGGEARRAALARVLAPQPESCCSTSRPTISICRRSNGSKANWPIRAPRWC